MQGPGKRDFSKYSKLIKYKIENAGNPAKDVITSELEGINRLRKNHNKPERNSTPECTGLALSGGGIRSATFSLGVLQALSKSGWLNGIDYLSTVSGGGYIGSSLTFLLKGLWTSQPKEQIQLSASEAQLPYGTDPDQKLQDVNNQEVKNGFLYKLGILRYLRQHGNYLFPGRGITFLSFFASYLRGFLLNILVFFPWLTLGIMLLFYLTCSTEDLEMFNWAPENWSGMFKWSALIALLFVIISAGYSFGTFVFNLLSKRGYKARTLVSKWIRYVILAILLFAILGAVELADEWLQTLFDDLDGEVGDGSVLEQFTGFISALAGLLVALKGFFKSGEEKSKGTGIWVSAGSALLLFGLLLLSYRYYIYLPELPWAVISLPLALFFIWLVVSLFFGRFTNLNYLSVHRYYRDRLMETFMPDLNRIFRKDWDEKWPGREADGAAMHKMCENELPYHLVNTNVVLVDSNIPKFKGRGGDNFILSPLYCGSNATGWRRTDTFMNGRMTLPTAMAISGAALNPNTGVGGEGMTRNRLLSMVLNMLNLRLGYWAPNPGENKQGFCPHFFRPNSFLFNHRENNYLVELSDGGHFENLGLYELLRRKLQTIIVVDAGMDPDFTFEDLGNIIEKARVDFQIEVEITLDPLIPEYKKRGVNPSPLRTSFQGYVVGKITYDDKSTGDLIFIKTTYIDHLPKDVVVYKNLHPPFPDQPTSDQFFDEKQFEAYRVLGEKIGEQMIDQVTQMHTDIADKLK